MSTKRETDTIEVRDPAIVEAEYNPDENRCTHLRFQDWGCDAETHSLRPGDKLRGDTGEIVAEVVKITVDDNRGRGSPGVDARTHWVKVDYGAGDYWEDTNHVAALPLGELAKQLHQGGIDAILRCDMRGADSETCCGSPEYRLKLWSADSVREDNPPLVRFACENHRQWYEEIYAESACASDIEVTSL